MCEAQISSSFYKTLASQKQVPYENSAINDLMLSSSFDLGLLQHTFDKRVGVLQVQCSHVEFISLFVFLKDLIVTYYNW